MGRFRTHILSLTLMGLNQRYICLHRFTFPTWSIVLRSETMREFSLVRDDDYYKMSLVTHENFMRSVICRAVVYIIINVFKKVIYLL